MTAFELNKEILGQRMSNTAKAPMICLRNIRKIFETDEVETHALANIDLDIWAGDYLSVSGPSGSGKSTLLAIIGLLDIATEGTYTLNGERVDNTNPRVRAAIRNREIGFIFQSFNLIDYMTVRENVELPLLYQDNTPKEVRRDRAIETLDMLGLSHRVNHYPNQLSGGQQQRVAVARAIIGRPSLLLADEPTGNLDSRNGEAVMQLLDELHASGSTICLVTHDDKFATRASKTVKLLDGRVDHT